jgi:DNA invertase Pin-like site-specific DNA recombinase
VVAFPLANALCEHDPMATDHEPSDDNQRIYARHKRHHEAAKAELEEVRKRAADDLLAGSTPAELAKLTGLSDEFFRRIARKVGAERKRPPTVGREVEGKRQTAPE